MSCAPPSPISAAMPRPSVDSAGDIPPAMEKNFLGVILNESDRMTHIVQDLLTLSRFDSGRSELKLERFSFQTAVRDIYNAVLMDAQRHGHTLTWIFHRTSPILWATVTGSSRS